MEARVRSLTINVGLMLVLQVVLNVSEFVMDCEELIHCYASALFDSNVILFVKVPSARVTNKIATVTRFLQDTFLPKDSNLRKGEGNDWLKHIQETYFGNLVIFKL